MLLSDLDFDLPPELVAQAPAEPREAARLLHLKRASGQTRHGTMRDFPALLRPDDLLVFNDTRVLRARLLGRKPSGGRVEALLLEEVRRNVWRALLKPSARLQISASVWFGNEATFDAANAAMGAISRASSSAPSAVEARLLERDGAEWTLEFQSSRDVRELLAHIGQVPLPPYIRALGSDENYQTAFARADPHVEGRAFDSAAAPTAGLHFSPELLGRIEARGIERAFVTLAVGTGTFAPVQVENLDDHPMHAERFHVAQQVADKINAHKASGGRVVAVGTTTVRTLESAGDERGLRGGWGETRLFLRPGAKFKVVDALLTNFHLPRSTLLALVAAFVEDAPPTDLPPTDLPPTEDLQTREVQNLLVSGTMAAKRNLSGGPEEVSASNGENGSNSRGLTLVRAAYREAIASRYRFFSWGDAMFIE